MKQDVSTRTAEVTETLKQLTSEMPGLIRNSEGSELRDLLSAIKQLDHVVKQETVVELTNYGV